MSPTERAAKVAEISLRAVRRGGAMIFDGEGRHHGVMVREQDFDELLAIVAELEAENAVLRGLRPITRTPLTESGT